MIDEKGITIKNRFGTVRFRKKEVRLSPRFKNESVRFMKKAVALPKRTLEESIRFLGHEYTIIVQLEITNFSFRQIGRTAATVEYDTNKPAKCIIYTRKEDPLGEWQGASWETDYHTTHAHNTVNLEQGTWYHLYVYAYDADSTEDTDPTYPPYYYRFKTGTIFEPGIFDGIHS